MNSAEVKEKLNKLKDEEVLTISVSNPDAFEIIVERYQEAFLRKARSIIGRRREVEDAVQDAFVKIYINSGRFKVQEGATFNSWAYKILINTCLTYLQKLKRDGSRRVEIDDEVFAQVIPDFREADRIEYAMDKDEFLSIVSRIPNTLARVLKKVFLEGKTPQDIAAEDDVSPSAIRTRIHRAKKEFKKVALKSF